MDDLQPLDPYSLICERFRKEGTATFAAIITSKEFEALTPDQRFSAVILGPLAAAMCAALACVAEKDQMVAVKAMIESMPEVHRVLTSLERIH